MADPTTTSSDPPAPLEWLRRLLLATHLIGPARAVDRTAKRALFVAQGQVEALLRLPVLGSVVYPLVRRIRHDDDLHVGSDELIRIVDALDTTGVRYWIVGGWGLDALIGCETRRHNDVDVLIDDYARQMPRVAAALYALGYRRGRPLGGTPWFPDADVFDDDSMHHVEVLSLGEPATDEAFARGLIGPDERRVLEGDGHPGLSALGRVAGRSVPTVSVEWQRLFHSGYAGRPKEAHAEALTRVLERRRSAAGPGEVLVPEGSGAAHGPSTLLLVPVFTFPTGLWKLCRLYRNDLNLVPPHVTLAFPFLPLREITYATVEQLRSVVADVPTFEFALSRIRWFDDEVVYLEPEPSEPFVALTRRLQELFPGFVPYGGEFPDVVPHVTLTRHGNAGDRRVVAHFAPRYIPLSSRATHCWLMADHLGPDRWSIVEVFDLAPDGAADQCPEPEVR